MKLEKQELLKRFAALTVRVGANVQKGQTVLINANVECADMVRRIAQESWLAGAGEVIVVYTDEQCARLRYEHGELSKISQFYPWQLESRIAYPKGEACYIWVDSDDPDAFAGLDGAKIGQAENARAIAMKPFHELLDQGDNQWTIVAVPSPKWAKRLFPQLSEEAAMERLWEAIMLTMRLDTPDPVAAWREHSREIADHAAFLNGSGIQSLEFKNSLGTDLSVELAQGYIWCGGASRTNSGAEYQANMPTEEVFSMPHKDRVNGRVVSALPLCYRGTLIEHFSFTFKDGYITDYTAEKGLDTLTQLLADPSCRRLGEVALVPYSSPIRRSGILFLSTLFDENAACHLAVGSAYPDTMAGCLELTREERAARGFNDSPNHLDFMFGTADLSVVGVRPDGSRITVFEAGEWVR